MNPSIETLKSMCDQETFKTGTGCDGMRGFRCSGLNEEGERYYYDWEICLPSLGWNQYDTTQDASYFGVWYNIEERATFSFCEGDLTLVIAPTKEAFKAEMASMAECYGAAPAWCIALDLEAGTTTHYIDEDARPDLSSL